MGNSEEGKSVQTEKPSPPDHANQANQPNVHVYPDWAAMQAYYGPKFSIPPYYHPSMASGHAPPPYMWGPPQPMMTPYGPPYAAIYPHGGVYTHSAVAIGPHSHGQGVPSSNAAGTPSSVETPTKISGNTDKVLIKNGFEGLAMSIGNDNAESEECGVENRLSQSVDTEGSSDGSDGNTSGHYDICQFDAHANQSRKRSCQGTPTTDGEEKTEIQNNPVPKETAASNKIMSVKPISVAGKFVGSTVSSGMTTALELRNLSTINSKANPTSGLQPCGVLPPEVWIQAEAEELARKVDNLNAENASLTSELNQLAESSEKLRAENATLREKLKSAQLVEAEEVILNSIDIQRATPISTENLLSRVNNSGSDDRTAEDENDFGENKPTSGAKLHQLLDNRRANVVAAS
ncbi:hypothetical protein TanjilG_30797 [Lupinus angustifolius]|uniref:G-box binding protein multifunctional mosaic region domain-containing protein n=1 Tax=Lupinus angustifolius TaxID=3871 RepID=A0A1J7HV22_LUPAN|nr:hypothetical protein TanjilG_30797 [Lupinus angustifolius]